MSAASTNLASAKNIRQFVQHERKIAMEMIKPKYSFKVGPMMMAEKIHNPPAIRSAMAKGHDSLIPDFVETVCFDSPPDGVNNEKSCSSFFLLWAMYTTYIR